MLDSFTYENHLGELIEFGKGNVLIDSNQLRDYNWSYNDYYGKASGFKKKMKSVPITVLIYGDNSNAIADKIFETFEKDILFKKHGKITINGYYMYGYFYGSQKQVYLVNGILKMKLNMVIDSAYWTKETVFMFRPEDSDEGEWLNFPHRYPYNFMREKKSVEEIINDSFVEQNLKITIYGACVNPTVRIGEHDYKMNCTLSSSEKLVINTSDKTIIKIADNGVETNMFQYRDLASYIFEKMPVGITSIQTLPSNVNADVCILEERSEPKWVLEHDPEKAKTETEKNRRNVLANFDDERLFITINNIDSLSFALVDEHLVMTFTE